MTENRTQVIKGVNQRGGGNKREGMNEEEMGGRERKLKENRLPSEYCFY